MKYITIIIIFIFIILINISLSNNLIKINMNNKNYYVQKTHSKEAVKILIILEKFIKKLSYYLIKENSNNKYLVKQLKKNIIIREIPEHYKGGPSYLKGKNIIFICLRKNKDEFETNINGLYFVIIHELAHIITKTYGHTKEYWRNNKLVLNTAIKYNLYNYKNYNNYPIKICNKIINTTEV